MKTCKLPPTARVLGTIEESDSQDIAEITLENGITIDLGWYDSDQKYWVHVFRGELENLVIPSFGTKWFESAVQFVEMAAAMLDRANQLIYLVFFLKPADLRHVQLAFSTMNDALRVAYAWSNGCTILPNEMAPLWYLYSASGQDKEVRVELLWLDQSRTDDLPLPVTGGQEIPPRSQV